MAPRYEIKDITPVLTELAGENDRAVIIVGAALVDYCMQILIEALIPPLPRDDQERLFTDSGLLGSQFAKSLWLYVTGVIGPKTRHDLDMIRRIRNETAHNPNPVFFKSGKVKTRALTIEFSREVIESKNPRARYLGAIHLLTGCFLLRTAQAKGSPELIAILSADDVVPLMDRLKV